MPKKNTAFNVSVSLYTSAGAFIANPGTVTAKISKDYGDWADVGTVSEEDSTYGQLKLALTNTEMNADVVDLYVVDDTADCVPWTATIYTDAATLGEIVADTGELQTDWVDGGRLDLLIDAIKAVTDALGATAAANLAKSAGVIVSGTVDSTAHSPTATEFEADDITETTADHYIGRVVIFTNGALQYQKAEITDYVLAGSNGHFTVEEMTEAPANNNTFIIL